jgi:hypothetical protein
MDEKQCNKCHKKYLFSNFKKYSNGIYSATCKKCLNEMDKLKMKQKRKNRIETVFCVCCTCNKEKLLKNFAKSKKFYKKKICLECYSEQLRNVKNNLSNNEANKNPNYRIKKSLAARLRSVMKKETHTMNYIGCNIQYLREWFEYNFDSNMTWDNYGSYWSIEHVIPVSKFNLENDNDKYKCWNWSNLVPVTIYNNTSKKNTLDQSQIQNIKEKLLKFKEEGSTTKWFSDDFLNMFNDHLKI